MDTWDDKTTGEKRSKIKVEADRVQFLDRRDDAAGRRHPARTTTTCRARPRRDAAPRPAARARGRGQRAEPRARGAAPPPARPPAAEPSPTTTISRSDRR